MGAAFQLLPRLPREGAREYSLRVLKHNLVHLHLPPGSMINAAELSEVAGVSKTPFREAMQELAKSGILQIFPQSGSRVSYIEYERIHQARFIRLSLETAAALEACTRIDPMSCLDFEEMLYQQEKSLTQNNQNALFEYDDKFHHYLFRLVGKDYAYELMEGVLIHFDRIRRLGADAGVVSWQRLIDDHRKIYEAIRRQDKTTVMDLMALHLSRYLEEERSIREMFPQYFADA